MKTLVGEAATLDIAAKLAELCRPQLIIHLQGDLGSGKTTFARGFINKLGYSGNVKSPTFTLVETYDLVEARLYHFDLYRLKDPLELEYIGFRDLADEPDAMCLIEWPERGGTELPAADFVVNLEYQGESRGLDFQANSRKGQMIIDKL